VITCWDIGRLLCAVLGWAQDSNGLGSILNIKEVYGRATGSVEVGGSWTVLIDKDHSLRAGELGRPYTFNDIFLKKKLKVEILLKFIG
jgi:hypothetical protein